jgi:hypothetical protein
MPFFRFRIFDSSVKLWLDTVPGLSSVPPRHRGYQGEGGMETSGNIHQIDVTENSLFY